MVQKQNKNQKKIQKNDSHNRDRWVMVSGGFDPIHIGHVRMFEKARRLGDKLVVVINNDNWIMDKKGYVFMPEAERKEIISKFPFVDKVVLTAHTENDPDRSVCRSLVKLKPAIFANGGDRKNANDIPEAAVCKELGIRMVFKVGAGGKVQSSSWMVENACAAIAPVGAKDGVAKAGGATAGNAGSAVKS